MTNEQISGRIKTILKVFKSPRLEDNYLISKRLKEITPHIVDFKLNYLPNFSVVKYTVIDKAEQGIPTWVDSITPNLSLYLDVFILRTKYIKPGYIEPINILSIVGDNTQVQLSEHILNYLLVSITNFYNVYHDKLLENGFKTRRNNRKNGKKEYSVDSRKLSSQYRLDFIEDIKTTLNKLLEDIKINHNAAFYKGLARQEKIDKYLRSKYNSQWKKVLSNTILKDG